MGKHSVYDQEGVGQNEADKDRQQHRDGFLHSAQVEQYERDDERDLGGKLVRLKAERKQRKQRVDAARDRNRNGEHVIENQRCPRGEARVRADQPRGDAVAPSARGKQLDDLVVGKRDDEHGRRRGECEVKPQLGVLAQRAKRLFGAIAGGGNPVCSQAHPGEKSDKGDMPSCLRIQGIEWLAEQPPAQIRKLAHERARVALPEAMAFSRRRENTVISFAACRSPFPCATSMPLRYVASASSTRPWAASAFP